MRNVAHPAMSRLALFSWAAAVGVVVLLFAFDWDRDVARGLLALVILLTGAAVAGTGARRERGPSNGDVATLGRALSEAIRQPAAHGRHDHLVAVRERS